MSRSRYARHSCGSKAPEVRRIPAEAVPARRGPMQPARKGKEDQSQGDYHERDGPS